MESTAETLGLGKKGGVLARSPPQTKERVMSDEATGSSPLGPSPVFEVPDVQDQPVFIVDDDASVLEGMQRYLNPGGL